MNEKTQLSKPVKFDDGVWQLDVPHDNSCFFWAVALAYLLPSVGNNEELQAKCTILLGQNHPDELLHLFAFIDQFHPIHCKDWFKNENLQHIIKSIWRNRIVDHMQQNKAEFFHLIIAEESVKVIVGEEKKFETYLQKMRDVSQWAGPIEMMAVSQLLNINIHLISKHHQPAPELPCLVLVAVNALGDKTGPENHFHFKLTDHDFKKILEDDEEVSEEDLDVDLELDKPSLEAQGFFPSYVLNIPVAIASDSDESSGEEDDDPTFNFTDETFLNPTAHIRLLPAEEKTADGKKVKKNHLRGTIDPGRIDSDPQKVSEGHKVREIVSVLSTTSFSKSDSYDDYKRMRVVFGLNKMRSLSSARNRSIERELNTQEYFSLNIKRFGFFWDGVWQKNSQNGWINISYKEAREFYKRFKKRNKAAAKEFRKKTQEKRGHMVPYREIRDAIKNHPSTRTQVSGARQSNPNQHVYLVFFDGDIISTNRAFSIYDKLYAHSGENPPVVMAGGYLVADTAQPLMELGIELDMVVRHQTASVIRSGVYYPEPNTLALVELDKDTIDEAFSLGNLYYDSPKETPLLMKHIISKRKLDPQNCFRFEKKAAIFTTCPTRMLREFSATRNHEGKIISWKLSDFKTMHGINQSHLKPRSWARNILEAIEVPSNISITISGKIISLSDKKIISDMLISLMSRIFKVFDPIFLAKTAAKSNPNSSFRNELVRILKDYDKLDKKLYPTSRKPSKPSKSKKEQSPAVKLKKQNSTIIWNYIDKIADVQKLIMVLNQLLGYSNKCSISAENVLLAAKKSHLGVVTLLRNRLSMNYSELFLQSFIRLNNDFVEDHQDQFEGDPSDIVLGSGYNLLMSEEAVNNKTNMQAYFRNYKKKTVSIFSAMPMHFAAIRGDYELASWLREKRTTSTIGWIGDIDTPCNGGVFPVHCAIRYCAEHAENTELVEFLVSENNINKVITHQDWGDLTAFSMIMVELKNPFPLLQSLLKKFEGKIEFIFPDVDLNFYFSRAVTGKYFLFADFIVDYVPNTEDALRAIIETMSPDVDIDIINYAEKFEVDIEEIIRHMGEIEAVLFTNNYKHAKGINSEGSGQDNSYDDEQMLEADNEFQEEDDQQFNNDNEEWGRYDAEPDQSDFSP